MSAATRAKVMRAVADLGYRGRSGRGAVPRTDRPSLVDLVLSGVEGTWANRALMGVERAATAAGVDLVVSVARRDGDWLTRLLERNLRGAVLALVDVTAEQLATLAAAEVPVVLLDPVTQPPSTVASVGAANWAGGRAAAEHLLGLGHERLAVLGADRRALYTQARIDGFRSAAAQPGHAVEVEVRFIEWTETGAAEAAAAVLGAAGRPTGVFACTDNIAAGVYDAAESLGLRIPEDVSVVGFDDLPEVQWLRPALTTVHQPISEMGEAAMRMLLRIMADPPALAPREELATQLVVRGSAGRR
ncbi:LacI family DNA-binding transcriptional regulator [Glycomyces scopariae]